MAWQVDSLRLPTSPGSRGPGVGGACADTGTGTAGSTCRSSRSPVRPSAVRRSLSFVTTTAHEGSRPARWLARGGRPVPCPPRGRSVARLPVSPDRSARLTGASCDAYSLFATSPKLLADWRRQTGRAAAAAQWERACCGRIVLHVGAGNGRRSATTSPPTSPTRRSTTSAIADPTASASSWPAGAARLRPPVRQRDLPVRPVGHRHGGPVHAATHPPRFALAAAGAARRGRNPRGSRPRLSAENGGRDEAAEAFVMGIVHNYSSPSCCGCSRILASCVGDSGPRRDRDPQLAGGVIDAPGTVAHQPGATTAGTPAAAS